MNEIVKVLTDYAEKKVNKKVFVRYVRKEYKRPNFEAKTLRDWLKNREKIMASGKRKYSDRCSIPIPR